MTKNLMILSCLTACSLMASDGAIHRTHAGVDIFKVNNDTVDSDNDGNLVTINGVGKAVGFRTGYDFIKSNSIYFGLGGCYHYGTVNTKLTVLKEDSSQQAKGEFAINVRQIEGRVGYTHEISPGMSFVPFIGISYLYSGSRSLSGYGMPTTATKSGEGIIGGYFEYAVTDNISVGLNAAKYSAFRVDYKTDAGTVTYSSNEPNYEVSLPITIQFVVGQGDNFQVNLEPYIQRQLDSKGDKLSGARLHLSCDF